MAIPIITAGYMKAAAAAKLNSQIEKLAAKGISHTALHAFSGAAGASISHSLLGFLDPPARELTYDANWLWPNLYLSSHEAMDWWTRTDASWENLRWLLLKQGINLPEVPGARWSGPPDQWRQYVLSRQTPPPLEILIQMMQLGRGDQQQLQDWVLRHGYKEDAARSVMLGRPYIFKPDESRILYYLAKVAAPNGQAPAAELDLFNKRLAAAGMSNPLDQEAFKQLVQSPTVHETTELAQRDLLLKEGGTYGDPSRGIPADRGTPEEQRAEFNRLMALEGETDPKIIEYRWQLRQRLPTEGELIEAAVKNAFVGTLAKILKLDDEYEEQPQFIVGTDRLGLSGSPFINLADMTAHLQNQRQNRVNAGLEAPTVDAVNHEAEKYYNAQDKSLLTWAQVFWRSHWVNLSPSQIYQCLHRQRPVDTTKPGGAEAMRRYLYEVSIIVAGPAGADARYNIACRYAMTTMPDGAPGLGFGRNPNVPPVTQDIVDVVLRANDYAPLFRPNLSAISYNVLRLVDIRSIVRTALVDPIFAVSATGYTNEVGVALPAPPNGGIDDPLKKYMFAWSREQFLDRGQTPDAAQSLATLAMAQGQQGNRLRLRPILNLYNRAFRVGLIDRERFLWLRANPIAAGAVPVSTGVFDQFTDIFSEADLAADMLDDTAAGSFLSEENAVFAAEDQIEEGFVDA